MDTAEFEQVFDLVNHKQARELDAEDFEAMQYAVDLYRGDLLEGWYQDWCIFERERFQMMNLMLLDKLVQYCEISHKYDTGLAYSWQILRHDHAYERAHRQIMRLYSMSGDRTQALHQYERCVKALHDELGVEPSARTNQLYEQIQLDTFVPSPFAREKAILQVLGCSHPRRCLDPFTAVCNDAEKHGKSDSAGDQRSGNHASTSSQSIFSLASTDCPGHLGSSSFSKIETSERRKRRYVGYVLPA